MEGWRLLAFTLNSFCLELELYEIPRPVRPAFIAGLPVSPCLGSRNIVQRRGWGGDTTMSGLQILGYSHSPIFLYDCEDQSLSLRGYHNLHIVKEICKNANCLSGRGCGVTELPNKSVPILEQYFTPVIEVKGKCEVWCPWDQENCP